MPVRGSTKSADLMSRWFVVPAAVGSGIMGFVVAQAFALSNPFPTPKQHDWVLEPAASDIASREVTEPGAAPVEIATTYIEPNTDEPVASEPASGARFVLASATVVEAAPESMEFKARWSNAVPYWKEPSSSPIVVPPQATRIAPPPRTAVAEPAKRDDVMVVVDRYLWEVYQRAPAKKDSSGDFTWKDPAAAKHSGRSLQEYVIGGMDPDFREQLYHAGRAMDAAGIHWSMLSAFRDDYRQNLASGLKAHGGNSQHGGSNATGGYGHGRAIDVTNAEGEVSEVWHWIDTHGATYGLYRPMPGYDPSHVQPRNSWHDLAHHLRDARTRLANAINGNAADQPTGSTRVSARTSRVNQAASN